MIMYKFHSPPGVWTGPFLTLISSKTSQGCRSSGGIVAIHDMFLVMWLFAAVRLLAYLCQHCPDVFLGQPLELCLVLRSVLELLSLFSPQRHRTSFSKSFVFCNLLELFFFNSAVSRGCHTNHCHLFVFSPYHSNAWHIALVFSSA